MNKLTSSDYESLAELRYQIRKFLHFSEQAAHNAGLESRQHQLLLALKGLAKGTTPRVSVLAERLQIQHHSAVELINRLVAGDFVRRHQGENDRREVLLSLTSKGERVLSELSLHHKDELRKQGPELVNALKRVMQGKKASVRNSNSTTGLNPTPKSSVKHRSRLW